MPKGEKEHGKFRKCQLSDSCEGKQVLQRRSKVPEKTSTQDPAKGLPSRIDTLSAADHVVNSLNDSSQGPDIPTCPPQGAVSWKVLGLFSKRTLFCCLGLKAHAGNRHGWAPWEKPTWENMAAADTAFSCLSAGLVLSRISSCRKSRSCCEGAFVRLLKLSLPQSTDWGWEMQNPLGASKLLQAGGTSVKVLRLWMRPWLSLTPYTQNLSPESKDSFCPASHWKAKSGFGQEPGHEVKVEKGSHPNGVEVIIITIIVITNIYWAHTLCPTLLKAFCIN